MKFFVRRLLPIENRDLKLEKVENFPKENRVFGNPEVEIYFYKHDCSV
jgi:hypothetical protein